MDKAPAGLQSKASTSAPCVFDQYSEAISPDTDDEEIDRLHLSQTVGDLTMSEFDLVDETLEGKIVAISSCGVPNHPRRQA